MHKLTNMKYYLSLLVFLLLSPSVAGQVFKGRVTDTKGNPVPYAALYLRELKSGFTTDDNGCFEAVLKEGNYTCEISSIGYAGQTLPIQLPKSGLTRDIVLAERVYELHEVNVTKGGEDPAYAVMRRAIGKAPYFRTQLKSYTAGTYLKGTGKVNDIPAVLKLSKEVRKEMKDVLGKLFVMEEQRLVQFTAPATWNSRVKASSSSFPDDMQIDINLTTVNLYAPELFGAVSPLSPGAFSYYRFRLDGCFVEGEHVVNKIKLLPKKDNPRLVSGYIYIIEDVWCISAADISFQRGGIKGDIKVTCKEVQPTVFLPTSLSMRVAMSMMGLKAESTYLSAIHYTQVEVNEQLAGLPSEKAVAAAARPVRPMSKQQQKRLQKIEELSSKSDLTISDAYQLSKLASRSIEEADTLRSKHRFERTSKKASTSVQRDSLAGKKDSLYWASVRSVPLRPEELESYLHKQQSLSKDSLKRMNHSSGEGSGSISVESDGSLLSTIMFGETFRSKNMKRWIKIYDLASYVPQYNFVDGLWVGAKLTAGLSFSDATSLRFTPSVYYTTARKAVVGSGELLLDYAPRRMGKLQLSGGVLSTDYNGESGESILINGAASLLFARNDVKLYEKRFLSIHNDVELANGLLFAAGLSWQQRKMLENSVSQSMFGKSAKSNIPQSDAFVWMPENELLKASFALEYTPAHYYRMSRGKKVYEKPRFPTFTLGYEQAFPLSGTTPSPSYQRAEFLARQKVEFGLFNVLAWSVNGGMFWDAKQMQFPDYKHFAATRLALTERTFNDGFFLLDNYAYSTASRWAQAGLNWYTPYLLLKYLPFLKRKSLDEALHLHSMVSYGRNPYSEVGYSIGFANVARVGVFAGFENLKYRSVGVSVSLPLFTFIRDY